MGREIDQILLLCFLGEEQRPLGCKAAGFHGHHTVIVYWTVLQNPRFYQFEAAVYVTQEIRPSTGMY